MVYGRTFWKDHIKDQNNQVIQQGTPVSAGNLNKLEVGTWNANQEADNASAAIRDAIPSGITKFSSIDYTYMKTNPNKIKLTGGGVAFVNGWKVDIPDGTIIDVGAPPTEGEREDLVFLEVWKDQINDAAGEKINSRIRVVQGVDFNKYPEGLGNTAGSSGSNWDNAGNLSVSPQGGNTVPLAIPAGSPSASTYANNRFIPLGARQATSMADVKVALGDVGLYTVGTGTQTSKDLLKTADGYSYAIPLFRIRRRNSGGYSVVNPNGARDFTTVRINATAGSNIVTLVDPLPNYARVGDQFYTSTANIRTIVAINGRNPGDTLQVSIVYSSSLTAAASMLTPLMERPDTLAANIIDDRDILDLRHQVSLTGFNYQALLEENFDKLLRGELQTKERKKMLKVYHGIPKTPIDANTVFYASMDGTHVPEVGTIVAESGTANFKPGLTGLGLDMLASGTKKVYKTGVALASLVEFTIDCIITVSTTNPVGNRAVFSFGNNSYIGVSLPDKKVVMYADGTGFMFSPSASFEFDKAFHLRITYKSNILSIYINGKLKWSGTTATMFQQATGFSVGFTNGTGELVRDFTGSIADLSISNIDRGANFATLPADFIAGYARIDKAFNGQRKTHSDALTSQYTTGIAKGAGSGHSKGLTVTQAAPGTWASGDTIKVKGLAGEIISGVIDSDTALATVLYDSALVNAYGQYDSACKTIRVSSVSGFIVGDTIQIYKPSNNSFSSPCLITAVGAGTITLSSLDVAVSSGVIILETTASTSVPVAKFMNAGTLTAVTGTWAGLGTNEATFTLGTNASLVNADVQIEYSLNMDVGQGGVPEVYTATLAGEYKGKKLIPGTVAVRDDLLGKTKADALPITVKRITATELQAPDAFTTEVETANYNNMATLGDGNTYTLSTSVNGEIPQALIAVDIIKEVETKYGPIPSVDKVGWVKSNVSKLTANACMCGSNPTGNKAYLNVHATSSAWGNNPASNTSSAPFLSVRTTTGISDTIKSDGCVYFLVYADTSNGTTPSSITIDSVSVEIELKGVTGYDMLVPENPRRDDGAAGVLLVRKETKEIQTYFDAVNTDGVVTYGDYVPKQGSLPVAASLVGGYSLVRPKAYLTTLTTKAQGMIFGPATNFGFLDEYSAIDNVITSALTDGSRLFEDVSTECAMLVPAFIKGGQIASTNVDIGKIATVGTNKLAIGDATGSVSKFIDISMVSNSNSNYVSLLVFLLKDINGAVYFAVSAYNKQALIKATYHTLSSVNGRLLVFLPMNSPLIK